MKVESVKSTHNHKSRDAITIPIENKHIDDLHEHWIQQAVSSLMAAIANEHIDTMDETKRNDLFRCSKSADTVPMHARCVVEVFDVRNKAKEESMNDVKNTTRLNRTLDRRNDIRLFRRTKYRKRIKRKAMGNNIKYATNYRIQTTDYDSTFGMVGKYLADTALSIKRKSKETWRYTMRRIKERAVIEKKRMKSDQEQRKRLRDIAKATPLKFIDERRRLEMANNDGENNDNLSTDPDRNKLRRNAVKVFREIVKLTLALAGHNVTDFDNKTLRLISPRLLSLSPESVDTKQLSIFSPSLFSIHSDGDGLETLLSLPNLMKAFKNKDYEQWMDFIMEASGVSDIVDGLTNRKWRDSIDNLLPEQRKLLDDAPTYFTKEDVARRFGDYEIRKIEIFERLNASYTDDQLAQLSQRGYSFMNAQQLSIVYGAQSPYNNTLKIDVDVFTNMTDQERNDMLAEHVRMLAGAHKFKVRMKRAIIGIPFLLQNLVFVGPELSTLILFTPAIITSVTLSPTILGPIILSPLIFVPIILSPRVLSPVILTPIVGVPVILSPYLMGPGILVPGVLTGRYVAPFVLSPENFC